MNTVSDSGRAERVATGPTWQLNPDGSWRLPRWSLGWELLQWTHDRLLQPDGETAGAPWNFTDEQARFLLWWYAVDRQGRYLYRRGMLRRVKGWGKDPFGAVWLAGELCGPVLFDGFDANDMPVGRPHPSPWVITAAVSIEQTKNTMRLFPGLFTDDAIAEHGIDIGKEQINTRAGILQAVTSSPRTLEGKRTTATLKNETHHWLANNDGLEMSEVIARNATKTKGRVLAISNAHDPGEGSDAELDFDAFLAAKTGRGDSDFLYDSLEAGPDFGVEDPEEIRQALTIARGDSVWLDLDVHVATILDPRTSEGEARRFYFNQIHAGDDRWVDVDAAWVPLASEREVPIGTQVVVGFDGSDSDDWTAIRCETQEGFQFTPRFPDGKPMIWSPEQHGGVIPRGEVNAGVAEVFKQFTVVRMYCDPPYWQSEVDEWTSRYGEKVVARWATYRVRQMAEALERFRTDILAANLSHDGCPITLAHLRNVHPDRKTQGTVLRKDKPQSKNKIDAVVASALAHEAALDATAANLWKRKYRAYSA